MKIAFIHEKFVLVQCKYYNNTHQHMLLLRTNQNRVNNRLFMFNLSIINIYIYAIIDLLLRLRNVVSFAIRTLANNPQIQIFFLFFFYLMVKTMKLPANVGTLKLK